MSSFTFLGSLVYNIHNRKRLHNIVHGFGRSLDMLDSHYRRQAMGILQVSKMELKNELTFMQGKSLPKAQKIREQVLHWFHHLCKQL